MGKNKICKHCKVEKPISDFYTVQKYRWKPYVLSYCKKCSIEIGRKNYINKLGENRAKRVKWQEQNRTLHNKHQRSYYARKREGITWGVV